MGYKEIVLDFYRGRGALKRRIFPTPQLYLAYTLHPTIRLTYFSNIKNTPPFLIMSHKNNGARKLEWIVVLSLSWCFWWVKNKSCYFWCICWWMCGAYFLCVCCVLTRTIEFDKTKYLWIYILESRAEIDASINERLN